MTGVMFAIFVPAAEHEQSLINKIKKSFNPIATEDDELLKLNPTFYLDKMDNEANLMIDTIPMEKALKSILEQLGIEKATWCLDANHNFWQVIFPVESRDRCENVLEVLKEHKIGKRFDSVVSVVPCSIYYHENSDDVDEIIVDAPEVKHDHVKNTAWNRFVSSVRARLTVAQVVENIKANAMLTFDFICKVTIATIMCAIGLTENSNVYLLSSMLISPMMGPVMAGTFGSVIGDKKLQKMGVQNEMIGLGIAMVVGFSYGAIICISTDKYGEQDWPTYEMTSRGEIRTLWVGCLIALLSGAAVALGILGDNIPSLVGVAISTSLMPPAVNAGLLWSIASVYYIKENESTRYITLKQTTYYSNDQGVELMALGGVSMCLTFTNIICIYAAGILVFMIKEVAPIASRDHERRRFWKHDIKIARNYNRTLQNEEGERAFRQFSCETTENLLHAYHSTDLSKDNVKINVRRVQQTWSPCMDLSKRTTIKELQELYTNLTLRNQSSSRALNFNFPTLQTETHRTSQPFTVSQDIVKITNEEKTDEECPLLLKEKRDKMFRKGKKKFMVTPCEARNS